MSDYCQIVCVGERVSNREKEMPGKMKEKSSLREREGENISKCRVEESEIKA